VHRDVGPTQHRFRTVTPMNPLLSLLRGLGPAGATANARAELESAHLIALQAEILVRRVNASGPADAPLAPAARARVA
jgi:hypothetical protein